MYTYANNRYFYNANDDIIYVWYDMAANSPRQVQVGPRFHPYVQVLCLFVIILAGENADAIDADDAMHGLVFPWDFDKRIKFGVAVHCVRRKHTRAILLCNGHVHCVCTRADGIVRERFSEKGQGKDETYLNT
jgi:hypothetical protein